ncbi:MAG: N-6 DNA methylase [Trueperaceae bacterium]|nr:N-6 DNA methylase [Trueperaceae bacterium]
MAHDFNSIRVSGNLLSNQFLFTSTRPQNSFDKLDAFAPGSFHPDWTKAEEVEKEVARAFTLLKDRYDTVRFSLADMSVSDTRDKWLLPVARTLGFEPVYQAANTPIPGTDLSYPLSHRGWDGPGAPVLHLLDPATDLDTKPPKRGAKSPQALVQSYLNQDPTQQWAIVSNGAVWRLVREYFHVSQPGFVEFNLVQMFETRDYDEFRSLFRLSHASRFLPAEGSLSVAAVVESEAETLAEALAERDEGDEDADEGVDADTDADEEVEERAPQEVTVWLEHCYRHARQEGSRAEVSLRQNVTRALEVLGNGLLTPTLREKLEDPERLDEYYRQLLRVIYRCIFLLFAEQRGLVPYAGSYKNGSTNDAQNSDDANDNLPYGAYADLYTREYSLSALRDLAEQDVLGRDDGHDLWERLLLTFSLAHKGNAALGVPAFNGKLFDPKNVDLVMGGVFDASERNRQRDLPRLRNPDVIALTRHLAFTSVGVGLERINYRDLEVEEIGHIYESLLDYAPRIAAQELTLNDARTVTPGHFFLDDRGTNRKTTGSYYTPKALVQEIITRTLTPVLDERLSGADTLAAQTDAILGIKVLDPACGSAAFLIAANDALAQALADCRWDARANPPTSTPTDAPTGTEQRSYQRELEAARRDVLSHCIYGVDLNDMAVELAKVALWINAAERGRPLSFLDHRIKHGNSLVGAPLNFAALGIHPDAFKGRGDADKAVLKQIRKLFSPKQARDHRDNPPPLFNIDLVLPNLDEISEATIDGVRQKEARYTALRDQDAFKTWQLIADYWSAAFFYPVKPDAGTVPNQSGLQKLLQDADAHSADALHARLDPQTRGNLAALKEQYHFFHYWLEHPEIFFHPDGTPNPSGGFDVIIGNPPWERVKLQEKEFFTTRDDAITSAPNAAKRKKLIKQLETTNPDLYNAFQEAINEADATSNFLRVSGRYPLSSVGDINTYQVFTELARDLTAASGRTGIIVPSGVATDSTTQDLFRDFVESRSLVSLSDFENREKLFQGVDSRYKFSLVILTAPGNGPEAAEFSFFNTRVEHLNDLRRTFFLTPEDFKTINPNTLTCPTFRTGRDADLTLRMYEQAGVFIDKNDDKNGNPWGASFLRMFDMSNDSDKFRTAEDLESRSYTLRGNRYEQDDDLYLPLYEGKMLQFYDHRAASIIVNPDNRQRTGQPEPTDLTQHLDPYFAPLPRYWVHYETLAETTQVEQWLFAFKSVTSSTNVNTFIGTPTPFTPIGHSCSVIKTNQNSLLQVALVGNFSSLTLDYVVKQKVGGLNLSFFLVEQFPVLSPHHLRPHLDTIAPKVLELTYTAWDIKPFADDLWREASPDLQERLRAQWQENAEAVGGGGGLEPPAFLDQPADGCPLAPFTWDDERRAHLRAELDALFAHLYNLSRDDLLWILDPRDVDPETPSRTFPGLRRNEEKRSGEYRTKRLVLHYFDKVAAQQTH